MDFLKKISPFTILIIALAAISISLMNLNDLSWSANVRSYGGLLLAILFLIIKLVFKLK